MASDWTSYDSAAETHERLGVPAMFELPARELAARMDFANAASALDVGAGSGIIARQASACPLVVALDPSLGMLRVARANGVARVVAGGVPGLPFADGAFDRVTAGFVLSHVQDREAALADMVRVLRRSGLVGVTAWGKGGAPFRDCWDGLLPRFVDADRLRLAVARFVPWQEWFEDAEHLAAALRGAGLRDARVDQIACPVRQTIEEFLTGREYSGPARFLRSELDDARWEQFRATAREEFYARFRDPIEFTRTALIGIGTK